ncbi:MAG TPA: PDGLE domain-containing protein [Coleofasciculaceae cyanobacterium]
MKNRLNSSRNRAFVLIGLSVALLVAIFLSPFASSDPDGLNRVAEDQGFNKRAQENPPAQKLPFHAVFDAYALRGVPEGLATPLAGLIGTLATFGIAWGAGKLLVKGSSADSAANRSDRTSQ